MSPAPRSRRSKGSRALIAFVAAASLISLGVFVSSANAASAAPTAAAAASCPKNNVPVPNPDFSLFPGRTLPVHNINLANRRVLIVDIAADAPTTPAQVVRQQLGCVNGFVQIVDDTTTTVTMKHGVDINGGFRVFTVKTPAAVQLIQANIATSTPSRLKVVAMNDFRVAGSTAVSTIRVDDNELINDGNFNGLELYVLDPRLPVFFAASAPAASTAPAAANARKALEQSHLSGAAATKSWMYAPAA